jgi:spoIIIJ-associated protein
MSDVTETTAAATAPTTAPPLDESAEAAVASQDASSVSADGSAAASGPTSAAAQATASSSSTSDAPSPAVPAPAATPSPAAAAAFATAPAAALVDDGAPANSATTSQDAGPARSAASLDDEGDVAADYIEELLDICDLDGDIDIEVTNGRAYISVNASGDSNLRILSRPDTVAALQELTRLAVQTKTGEFSRLILDVGGSRELRQRELEKLVDDAVARLDGGSDAAHLEPMSSYERKLVHDIVAARGLTSESEGEGRDRHTVISRA